MALWDTIKAAIDAVITDNQAGAITGPILNQNLKDIVDAVCDSQFKGVAIPASVPFSADGPIFYFASTNGTYANFAGVVVTDELAVLSNSTGSWLKTQILDLTSLGGGGSDTAEQIRDKLEALTGVDRLDASAIQNLPSGGGISQLELEEYLTQIGIPLSFVGEQFFIDDIAGFASFNGSGGAAHDDTNDRLVINNSSATGASY